MWLHEAVTARDVAAALPDIPVLRERCQALAALDAILSPEWESRYFSFDAHWGPGEQVASMRNGSGDEYDIVFGEAGVFIRGFAHESPMSPAHDEDGELWPGLLDAVPEVFAGSVAEPAFSYDGRLEATVCVWRETGDDRWHTGDVDHPAGPDPDGADGLFAVLVAGTPQAYRAFAEDYYERPVDAGAVRAVFAHEPLTDALVTRLNPDLTLADLAEDLARIGYGAR
ncbi:hypothetical protein Daura_17460 [Dactylosporangium aurantiacum]|uniref:Uncharacterized protein n=1 Tax=Dactylosporangium aurantiacum TaxID=35754 RepID=A0A9Q9IKF3_9ACTN|nr:hypothetical protein [Dactylosporangium aurantiacum]MDG6103297.1 hypothetical protein [Dactylosporangium aurantiacum]UWZ57797.1 hypothetical protein Daura_17460 [Dactylosporangium aurantiacum]